MDTSEATQGSSIHTHSQALGVSLAKEGSQGISLEQPCFHFWSTSMGVSSARIRVCIGADEAQRAELQLK